MGMTPQSPKQDFSYIVFLAPAMRAIVCIFSSSLFLPNSYSFQASPRIDDLFGLLRWRKPAAMSHPAQFLA